MSGWKENSKFCFLKTFDVAQGEAKGNFQELIQDLSSKGGGVPLRTSIN